MNTQQLTSRLVSEFGYPPEGADLIAEKLVRCSPKVQEAFETWWDTGLVSRLQVKGYTVQRLMEGHGMNTVAAFLTLDWLHREPQEALKSLRKGHDMVGLSSE